MLALFLDKLYAFPLWVKQIIYLQLHKDLTLRLSEDFITINEADIFQLTVPTLSLSGLTELYERKSGMDENIYNFLANINDGLNIIEISMNNFWTMEEVAKYYIFCLEQNYLNPPGKMGIYAMAGFIAGKFKTGEYFRRTGKINVEQLKRIILRQKQSIEAGKPLKTAEIMLSLGYATEKDTASLLLIKEESQKRFILDSSIIPISTVSKEDETKQYEDEIAKLTEQNKLLKEQLNKILIFVKQHG